jgi:hypothetical protein
LSFSAWLADVGTIASDLRGIGAGLALTGSVLTSGVALITGLDSVFFSSFLTVGLGSSNFYSDSNFLESTTVEARGLLGLRTLAKGLAGSSLC